MVVGVGGTVVVVGDTVVVVVVVVGGTTSCRRKRRLFRWHVAVAVSGLVVAPGAVEIDNHELDVVVVPLDDPEKAARNAASARGSRADGSGLDP